LGTIESVKAVSEIYSPLSGTVTAVNSDLDGQPELVNSDPHGDGWYCKIELADPGQVEGLMDAEAYDEFAQQAG
jgi:glycine cleavage system H protein